VSGAYFVLTDSKAAHIECAAENIEHTPLGMPHIKLAPLAQSLLDTQNMGDLNDLVDAQDLTLDWGRENLKLFGDVDWDWAMWRLDILFKKDPNVPWEDWTTNVGGRRKLWESSARGSEKRKEERVRDRRAFERWAASDIGKASNDAFMRGDRELARHLYEEYKKTEGWN
jgi:hypothetical protein